MAQPRSQRPPHPAWSGRKASATADDTADVAEVAAPALTMANTKAELVQAAVDQGYAEADLDGYTKADLMGLLDES